MVFHLLTGRQGEYLRLRCAGKTKDEIAAAMNVKTTSLRVYRDQVMQRVRAGSIADICQMIEAGETPEPIPTTPRKGWPS